MEQRKIKKIVTDKRFCDNLFLYHTNTQKNEK